MARRKHSKRRRRRGRLGFLYKLLSVAVICTAIVLALTLFFRVETITVSGQRRYTEDQIREASGVESGDNLYLLNKHEVAARITQALPYVESIRINRKLPDTLRIEVRECGPPMALVQDGFAWLISPQGKILEQAEESAAGGYASITGCQLLAPAVGESIALATEYAAQQSSLVSLLGALEEAGLTEEVDGIRLDDLSCLNMDYAERFTVRMAYGADYGLELQKLTAVLASEKIQSNMTGTIDMQLDSERVLFYQNVR